MAYKLVFFVATPWHVATPWQFYTLRRARDWICPLHLCARRRKKACNITGLLYFYILFFINKKWKNKSIKCYENNKKNNIYMYIHIYIYAWNNEKKQQGFSLKYWGGVWFWITLMRILRQKLFLLRENRLACLFIRVWGYPGVDTDRLNH